MKHISLKHVGNICIVLSLIGFLFIFYPVLYVYLFPTKPPFITKAEKNGFYIAIPKIHAYSKVIANVNPWDEQIYKKVLQKGVAQAAGSALPDENGTTFFFAHSSGNPWEITRNNTIFLRLFELRKGDNINVYYKNKLYIYSVVDKKEVWPDEIKYLKQNKDNTLILQTCTPIGTSLKRLLIFAHRA